VTACRRVPTCPQTFVGLACDIVAQRLACRTRRCLRRPGPAEFPVPLSRKAFVWSSDSCVSTLFCPASLLAPLVRISQSERCAVGAEAFQASGHAAVDPRRRRHPNAPTPDRSALPLTMPYVRMRSRGPACTRRATPAYRSARPVGAQRLHGPSRGMLNCRARASADQVQVALTLRVRRASGDGAARVLRRGATCDHS
jgi:hypothetical protein